MYVWGWAPSCCPWSLGLIWCLIRWLEAPGLKVCAYRAHPANKTRLKRDGALRQVSNMGDSMSPWWKPSFLLKIQPWERIHIFSDPLRISDCQASIIRGLESEVHRAWGWCGENSVLSAVESTHQWDPPTIERTAFAEKARDVITDSNEACIWANSGRWWTIGKSGVVQSWVARVRHNWTTIAKVVVSIGQDVLYLDGPWTLNNQLCTGFYSPTFVEQMSNPNGLSTTLPMNLASLADFLD